VTLHRQVLELFNLSNAISDLYFALAGSVEDLQQDIAVLSLGVSQVLSYFLCDAIHPHRLIIDLQMEVVSKVTPVS
jgi:hypothetical protein